ncbi:hypothetical protein [Microbacterium sp. K36]|uniref:hypothetical protein n=1 Tax=Microbacterium sp. K36 TaxID=2305439 RepID=UPI00109C9001|nr:hypothetical protein [Microbacterium sp. K36]
MRHRVPLPPYLGPHFAVRDAAAIGVGRKRYSSRDLARPFAGVRSAIEPATFDDRVASYLPRLREGQAFAGRTALRLWGLPASVRWSPGEPLDVAVHTGTSPPRTIGVRGRRIAPGRADTWHIHGVPTVDPVSALFLCAREFASVPMVVALDALLTSSDVYPGLRTGRPVATIESIDRQLTRWGRFPGCGRIRDALPLARPGVESPKETEARLLLRSFDLPEPAIQHVVSVDGRFLARVDLAYPECRIAIEYEGDGHRTDRDQWRIDIRRQRDLEDRGWLVIRVTELDLRDGGGALAARVRRALISRGGVRG